MSVRPFLCSKHAWCRSRRPTYKRYDTIPHAKRRYGYIDLYFWNNELAFISTHPTHPTKTYLRAWRSAKDLGNFMTFPSSLLRISTDFRMNQ